MAQIQSAPKTKMKVSEFYYFCLLIFNYLSASNFSVLKFQTYFDYFTDKFGGYGDSIHKLSKMDYNKKSGDMKKKLNFARTSLFNLIASNKVSDLPDIKEAALILMDLIDKSYRNLSKLKYRDLLLKTLSLLNDLKSDEYKVYVEKLQLASRIETIQKIYNECLELESKLITATGENKRLRKTVNTRRELNVAYDRLVAQLNSLAQIEGDKEYLDLFTWWNALIDDYRVKISFRTGAGTGGKTQTEEISQPDPNKGADNKPSGGGGDDRPEIE